MKSFVEARPERRARCGAAEWRVRNMQYDIKNRIMRGKGLFTLGLVWIGLLAGHPVVPGAVRAVRAQPAEGQRIAGFEVPDFDDEMRLQSMLFGDYARIMPNGEVEITNLMIEFYTEDREVEMRVTSPECIYDRATRDARSDSNIRIARENMIITGKQFVWSADNGRFEIFSDARVLLKGLGDSLHLGGLR